MKTWIKRTLIGLLGAGALFGGLAAWAGHHHHRWGHGAMSEQDLVAMQARVVERLGKRLELDEAQKSRLNTLADTLREQRRQFMPAGQNPREQLQALVAGNAFDRASASALVERKLAAAQGGAPKVIEATADFFDSLRPEQQAQVREFIAKGRHHHE